MQILSKHKFFSALILMVVLGLTVGIFGSAVSSAGGREKRTVQKQGWGYTLDIENGNLSSVTVNYDYKTVKGIEAYAIAQHQENEQLFKSGVKQVIAASLVFKRPLSWDEADAFVQKYRIYASGYDLRTIEENNPPGSSTRGTLGIGLIRDGKTLKGFNDQSRQLADQQVQHIGKADSDKASIRGVIGMQVTLDYPEYEQVSGDKDVYLVEMTRQILKSKLQTKAEPQMNGVSTPKTNLSDVNLGDLNVVSIAGPLYRHLEDTGIAPK